MEKDFADDVVKGEALLGRDLFGAAAVDGFAASRATAQGDDFLAGGHAVDLPEGFPAFAGAPKNGDGIAGAQVVEFFMPGDGQPFAGV